MCLLIDTGDLPNVFNETSTNHDDFSPVKEWIINGDGILVFGSEAYMDELSRMSKYADLILQLKKNGDAKKVPDEDVEPIYRLLVEELSDTACDDEHLIAIAKATELNLVCVTDRGAQKFLQDDRLYHSPTDKPSIYSDASHAHLLSESSIVPFCC